MQKSFILGIGAAKCGTTWLFDYLHSHPQFTPGPQKEMHIFKNDQSKNLAKNILNLPWHRYAGRRWALNNLRKAYLQSDWRRYYSIYEKLLASGYEATGDISPSYISLRSEVITSVIDEWKARDVKVVGILLLRDPVERLISEFRYLKKMTGANAYRKTVTKSLNEIATDFLQNNQAQNDQNYANGIKLMDSCFPSQLRFVELYETMFKQGFCDSICDVAGLNYHPANLSKIINSTAPEPQPDEETICALRERLAPAYDAAEVYFGAEHLSKHWKFY